MVDVPHAVVLNGLVENVQLAPAGWTSSEPGTTTIEISIGDCGPGWFYDGHVFTAPALPPPTPAQLLAAASDYQNKLLAGVWSFKVQPASGDPVSLTTRLDDKGQSAMTQLAVWSGLAAADASEPYSNVDFSAATLTPDMARSLALQAGQAKSSTYSTLNAVAAAILATPPTITTVAQIQAAAWPTPESS